MDEQVFFEQGEVRITNARFIVGSQTFAMSGVTSVKSSVTPPSRVGPLVFIIVGLFMLFATGIGVKIFGLIAIGVGVLMWSKQKAKHAVFLSSASGEVQALADTDGEFIGGVVLALNDVLVHRG